MPDTDLAPRPLGPPLYLVCDRCNYDRHICFGCGDNLRHDDNNLDGTPHVGCCD